MIHVLENIRIRCHLVSGIVSDPLPNQTGVHSVLHITHIKTNVLYFVSVWAWMRWWPSHLRCVVHLDFCDLPVAGFCVVLQPGLAGKEATHSEHPHACQQGEEATLPADILPGQHRQHLPCERPPHRLIVQGEFLGLSRPGLQLSVRPDLPSHFCYEAKSLFLHHDCVMYGSYSTSLTMLNGWGLSCKTLKWVIYILN